MWDTVVTGQLGKAIFAHEDRGPVTRRTHWYLKHRTAASLDWQHTPAQTGLRKLWEPRDCGIVPDVLWPASGRTGGGDQGDGGFSCWVVGQSLATGGVTSSYLYLDAQDKLRSHREKWKTCPAAYPKKSLTSCLLKERMNSWKPKTPHSISEGKSEHNV